MDEPVINQTRLEQENYRRQAAAQTAIYAGLALASLCREARELVADERERRRIAFNRPPRGLEGGS